MNYKKIYQDKFHSGAYLFYGDEKLLIENALKYLINLYIKSGTESFNLINYMGRDASSENIIAAAETYPVMSDKKIVVVKDVAEFVKNQSFNEDFYVFLDKISDFSIVLFLETEDLNKTTKFYKYFKKNNRNIEFPKLEGRDLYRFVETYFAREKKKISNADISYFIKESLYTSKNTDVKLFDLKNEILKIVSSTKNDVIRREDIDRAITENIDTNIFKFTDALMERNVNRAILELDSLYKLNEPVQKIFIMMIRQVRLLLGYGVLFEKRYTPDETMRKLGIKKYEYTKIVNGYKNFTKEFLRDFYEELLKTDEHFKTTSIDSYIEMQSLVVKYCSPK